MREGRTAFEKCDIVAGSCVTRQVSVQSIGRIVVEGAQKHWFQCGDVAGELCKESALSGNNLYPVLWILKLRSLLYTKVEL